MTRPWLEISDLVVEVDDKGRRRPVAKRSVLDTLALGRCLPGARRVVEALPTRADGTLDETAVDDTLLRAHLELQRLAVELRQVERLEALLCPILDSLREAGARALRVVDLGCGVGYVLRSVAARGKLQSDVELLGADFNPALIALAAQAAHVEGLRVRFVHADALELAAERPNESVLVSSCTIHHFRDQALQALLGRTARVAAACLHVDIKPSWAAPLGTWLFHRARMKVRLARHDGLVSTLRAHSAQTLLTTAKQAAPTFRFAVVDGRVTVLPIVRVMHCLLGVRANLAAKLEKRLGSLTARLWPSGHLEGP